MIAQYVKDLLNKPDAQAAGADPSRRNSTKSHDPPILQNRRNSWTSNLIWMPFKIYNILKFPDIVYFMTESSISNH